LLLEKQNKKVLMFKKRQINRARTVRVSGGSEKSGSFFGKILFLLVLIGLFYFLFFSEFFNINSIRSDVNDAESASLSSRIVQQLNDTRGENLLFLNTKNLETRLERLFPDLERIVVYKSYPKTLWVSYSRHPETANIVFENASGRNIYVINTIGMVVRINEERTNLPFIRLDRDEPINMDEALIKKNDLDYIIEVSAYFEDKFGMRVRELIFKQNAREVHLNTEKNFMIWIDIQKDFESQLRKLKKAAPNLDIYNESLEYVDLRIAGNSGDRIIYKRR